MVACYKPRNLTSNLGYVNSLTLHPRIVFLATTEEFCLQIVSLEYQIFFQFFQLRFIKFNRTIISDALTCHSLPSYKLWTVATEFDSINKIELVDSLGQVF